MIDKLDEGEQYDLENRSECAIIKGVAYSGMPEIMTFDVESYD